MATRFGDLFDRVQKLCALLQMLLRARKAVFMAAVRGRPSGLPVFRSRFANLRTAVTHSFGDDLRDSQPLHLIGVFKHG